MLFVRTVDEELVCGLVLGFGGGPELIRGRGLFQHSDRNSVIDLNSCYNEILVKRINILTDIFKIYLFSFFLFTYVKA